MFVKKSHKEKLISTLCDMFYCDISDHFISFWYDNSTALGNRPTTRISGIRNCEAFVKKMGEENWNVKQQESEKDYYHIFRSSQLCLWYISAIIPTSLSIMWKI